MEQDFNTRILVIDDDENVRDSFREILQPSDEDAEDTAEVQRLSDSLFDNASATPRAHRRSTATFDFEYSEASNGKRGYEMIKKALEENKPYAAVFVDMRMPGWDGLETVQQLRRIDKHIEVVFITAYSDHSIEEIVTAVGTNVSYHCKPFSVDEIEQIATKAIYEWNKTKNLEELINTISLLRGQRWEMDALLSNILQQVSFLLGTHSALIAMKNDGKYEKILAIGNLCDEKISNDYLSCIPIDMNEEVYQNDDYAYFRIEEFGVLAIFEKDGRPLNNERIYIVRLFLEQAAQAVRNVDLQEELLRKEKLSAVGKATSMIAHDLKNSIGAIAPAVEAIEEHPGDPEFASSMHSAIKEAAQDGVDFVKDLLDFAGDKKAEKTPLLSKDLLLKIERRTLPTLSGTRVKLKIDGPEDICFTADKDKIYRAVSNLIKNAVESFARANISSPEVGLSLNCDEKNVYIKVSDNGPGIPEDIVGNIFTPFVSFGKADGSGLGLAIVKQIVEAHGGEISLQSSSNGATFCITLPLDS